MLETLIAPPPDKILQLAADFRADPRPDKLDLGIGVYRNEAGETVILNAVKEAERRLLETEKTKSYVGPSGNEGFNRSLADIIFGDELDRGRLCAAQAPGGSGSLRLLCELVARSNPQARVWLSDPTWPNHPSILRQVGLEAVVYPYFDRSARAVDYDAMRAALAGAGPGDVILLHGCCHNPTGANLTLDQWRDVAAMAAAQGFLPFIDLAYQGFGDGLDEDVAGVRIVAAAVPELLLAASCSKNFALYKERVGCAFAIVGEAGSASAALANMKALGRANHSMPPDHGASLVEIVLGDRELADDWRAELAGMRERMLRLRQQLAASLRTRTNSDRYDFIADHRGMFSLLGATPEQVQRLKDEFAIYLISDSRMNVAGLTEDGIDRFADALVKVGL